MLPFLLAVCLSLLLVGVALPRMVAWPPAFWAHLVLAVGVMSLINAAMQHFVPVLCRSRGAGPWTGRLPLVMLAAGLLATGVFAGWLEFALVTLAAAIALLAALLMLAWMIGRGRAALGRPHPGLDWYLAAIGCLVMGLLAAALMPWFPAWYGGLRAFHLHINLYGFVGLTAIGTLQVLMPTVANRPDPEVMRRLRLDLKWALAGALLLALGKAAESLAHAGTILVWSGVLAWVWPIGRLAGAWWRQYRSRIFILHAGEPVLAVALLGYFGAGLSVLTGTSGGAPLAVYLPGFLLPLVSGAAAQLAPVWFLPSLATSRQAEARQALVRYAGVRALLFLGAILLAVFNSPFAAIPALVALFWFLIMLAVWLWRSAKRDRAG